MTTLARIAKNLARLALLLAIGVAGVDEAGWLRLSASNSKVKASHTIPSTSSATARAVLPNSKPETRSVAASVGEAYGRLPLSFEANQGQVDSQVKFLSREKEYTLFLTSTEAVLELSIADCRLPIQKSRKPNRNHLLQRQPREYVGLNRQSSVLRMTLVGANPAPQVIGLDGLPGKSNYFIGNDPKKWQTNIPTYVKYRNVYPGVDLVYYGNQRQLEYDFVVAPGTDPEAITLRFQDPASTQDRSALQIDDNGDLLVDTAAGLIRQHKPLVYQEADGVRLEIAGDYVLKAEREVSFQVAAYDLSKPLIIDPVLSYSTYLGGSGDDVGIGIAVDSTGSIYLTGYTSSTNFPTANPLHPALAGGKDAFVTKLNPQGSALAYSTYLGGGGDDYSFDIAIDAKGNANVTGWTSSANFPTVNALQPAASGPTDAFVAKLNSTGSALIYSTYLGGSEGDVADEIAVDSSGNAYVTGHTESINFPTANALQPTFGGGFADAFVCKLNSIGSALIYSTFLGGSDSDSGSGIAVDAWGNAYVTGETHSSNFPTANALQPTLSADSDAFVAKLNPVGSSLVYSTYLGGNRGDAGFAIALDALGNAYVTGLTTSTNFPTSVGAFQPCKIAQEDPFVAKLDPTGSSLVYSTYLGGYDDDAAFAIAVDGAGSAYVTGSTFAPNFPIANALQSTPGGNGDAFVAKLDPTGESLCWETEEETSVRLS